MANPKNSSQNLLSPCQLANDVVPMAVTPSDTGSSLSSFNASEYLDEHYKNAFNYLSSVCYKGNLNFIFRIRYRNNYQRQCSQP